MGLTNRIDSFNPYIGLTDSSHILYGLVYDCLQGVGNDLQAIPNIALSWYAVPADDPDLRIEGMPYGMPFMEFQEGPLTPNTPLVASFEVTPRAGDTMTNFTFDAPSCSDLEDLSDWLMVRWDWDGDGTFNTDWSYEKVAHHQFAAPGTYDVTVEVRDTGNLTDAFPVQVVVTEWIPEFNAVLILVLSVLGLVGVLAHRRAAKWSGR